MADRRTIPKRVNSYDRDAPTPAVGSRWIWEYGKPHAQETITVTDVKWNGEEWWVCTVADDRPLRGFITGEIFGVRPGKPYWNDLGRFWEAVSPISAADTTERRAAWRRSLRDTPAPDAGPA